MTYSSSLRPKHSTCRHVTRAFPLSVTLTGTLDGSDALAPSWGGPDSLGQTFVEQTHNFPLFLLHNRTATFSKVSQKFFASHRPTEPRISDRRYTLIHGNWKLSCSSRPEKDFNIRMHTLSMSSSTSLSMKMSFSTSMPGLHGCVSVRDHASIQKEIAALGSARAARQRAHPSDRKFRPFAPPPRL